MHHNGFFAACRLASTAIVVLLGLWSVGIHVADLARVVVALCAIFLLLEYKTNKSLGNSLFDPSVILQRILFGFLVYYCILIPVYLISKVYAGSQGIDFAIFTQVIDSVARLHNFASSMIANESVSFLGHHFVPFLAVPGLLGVFGIPSYVSGSIIHGLSVSSAVVGVFWISRLVGLSRGLALFATLLCFINPSLRHTVFWGIHDETFAIGIIPWVFVSWLLRRYWLSVFLLALCCLTKESMFLFSVMFAIMAVAVDRNQHKTLRREVLYPYLTAFFIGSLGFFAYFFLQPWFLGKTFDHFNKVASLTALTNWHTILEKTRWLAYLFLPVLAFPLYRLRTLVFLLPVCPFLGIVLISGFAGMYSFDNYYSAVPSLLICITSLLSLPFISSFQAKVFNSTVSLLLVAIAFSFASGKPGKDLFENLRRPKFFPESLVSIPDQATVVASPSASLFLFRVHHLHRLWLANQTKPPYDFIVVKATEQGEVDPLLIGQTPICSRNGGWIVWCKDGKVF